MAYFTIHKHNDRLYQIKDALGSLITVVLGSEKTLVFDTGYGLSDLPKEIQKISDKPLIVIDSHGHMDHTGGNYQFPLVYIHKDDYELVKKHNSLAWRESNIERAINSKVLPEDFNKEIYLSNNEGNIRFLEYGDIFDLGDIKAEVVPMPGHTQGSIGLLIKEMKLLLVADATCPYVWLFLDESTSVGKYKETVSNTLKLDFDYFLVGHGPFLYTKDTMNKFLEVAENIKLEESKEVKFTGFEKQKSYYFAPKGLYNPDGVGIIFNPDKM